MDQWSVKCLGAVGVICCKEPPPAVRESPVELFELSLRESLEFRKFAGLLRGRIEAGELSPVGLAGNSGWVISTP